MKKILIALLLLSFAFGLYYVGSVKSPTKKKINKLITVSQSINKQQSKTTSIKDGATALDLLRKTATIETKGEGANAFVTTINGRAADSSKKEYWAFYIDGKLAEVGAGSYKLKDKDKLKWKLETY